MSLRRTAPGADPRCILRPQTQGTPEASLLRRLGRMKVDREIGGSSLKHTPCSAEDELFEAGESLTQSIPTR